MKRRDFMLQTAGLAAVGGWTSPVTAKANPDDDLIVGWNEELTSAIAATSSAPTVAARAVSMVYEAAYNAWASYGAGAAFTLPAMRKRPAAEARAGKSIAISRAVHGVLGNLFPSRMASFDAALLQVLAVRGGIAPSALTAMATGQLAADALLQSRQHDGSNQQGSYADTSNYTPANTADKLNEPWRWQPLWITDNDGSNRRIQTYVTPHWGGVRPFALPSGDALRPTLGQAMPTLREMQQLIDFSANLDDGDKAFIDFWAANPGSVAPAGMWTQIAGLVSDKDKNTLDDDVKLFFALGQALHDAGIAAWDAKRAFDSCRPITAIRYAFAGRTIRSWAGPGLGTQWIRGEEWHPYQRFARPTPAFAEFLSGHSTFSAAAATVIAGLRGSDDIKLKFSFPANGVPFDPTVPAKDVKLKWQSLSEAADAAGLSRRLSGIHFERGDLEGRELGRGVGSLVLARCQRLFGSAGKRDD